MAFALGSRVEETVWAVVSLKLGIASGSFPPIADISAFIQLEAQMPDFQSMFVASNGQPVRHGDRLIYMADRLPIAGQQKLVLTFDSIGSDWRQGVHLSTEGTFETNGQIIRNAVVFWYDTAPTTIEMVVTSSGGEIVVKNVWDVGDGVMHSWHNGGAMVISVQANGRLYQCNDGRPDDDFNDLVFSLRLGE